MPPNGCLYPLPHFGLLKILFLELHTTLGQQRVMDKRIITFKHNSFLTFFSIPREIAGNQLLSINLMQYSILLRHVYRCVVEETCKATESLRYFISDYDTKQYVKRPVALIFRAH